MADRERKGFAPLDRLMRGKGSKVKERELLRQGKKGNEAVVVHCSASARFLALGLKTFSPNYAVTPRDV